MLAGMQPNRPLDAIFVNSPLKDYGVAPRLNDFTLPVLGLGYIATYAASLGFNVAVLDVESAGLSIAEAAAIINAAAPRWVGLNLLAPTYRNSVALLARLDPGIQVMLGGHQAKAMPDSILGDPAIPRIDALVLGEGEYRVAALLEDVARRKRLPGVMWRDRLSLNGTRTGIDVGDSRSWLAPDIDELPFVDRDFLIDDPFVADDGTIEATMIGSRGCPYNCSFCGAAATANPDVDIRTRDPRKILQEMHAIAGSHGVNAFRFVDDLFLANLRFMRQCLGAFSEDDIGARFSWDATGRINVLSRVDDDLLELMRSTGCREVALGIESASQRLLEYMGKKITPAMTEQAVDRLTGAGIGVKGYFIFGFPTETGNELEASVEQIHRLWEIADRNGSTFRASAFEFRPYPGTPEWLRLMATGLYEESALLDYTHVDLAGDGSLDELRARDEFNFSVNIQFGGAPIQQVRRCLSHVTVAQAERKRFGTRRDRDAVTVGATAAADQETKS